MLKKLFNTGFFHVFGTSVINKIISFCSGIFLVRLLSKGEFGLYSYVSNIIAIFLLFNGLGTTSGMLQFGSENYKKNPQITHSYFKFGATLGIAFNLFLIIFIVFFVNNFELSIFGANKLLLLMAALPLLAYIYSLIEIYFRVSLKNKNFAYLNSLNTILLFTLSIIGALLYNVYGVVIFRYIAFLITIIIGAKLSNVLIKLFKSDYKLNKLEKKNFLNFSLIATFNNAIAQLLYVIDIFLIGLLIAKPDVIASYKTATLIPFALNFIPMSIVTYIYPYFARNNNDKQWIRKNYIKLIKYLGLLNIFISVSLYILAPIIIKYIFGAQYMDSVTTFRILAIGYFFAGTFRIITGNILVMIKKVKFNFYLSIFTGVLNIVLDIILIKIYGSEGAAITTVIVFLFTSIISTVYLFRWFNKK